MYPEMGYEKEAESLLQQRALTVPRYENPENGRCARPICVVL